VVDKWTGFRGFGQGGFHTSSGGGSWPIALMVKAGLRRSGRERGLIRIALLCLCWLFAVAKPARPQGTGGTLTTSDAAGAIAGML
jgi:hypothetical protein